MIRKVSPGGAMELRPERSRRLPLGGAQKRQFRQKILLVQRCVCGIEREHVCLKKKQGMGSGKKRDKGQAGSCQSR